MSDYITDRKNASTTADFYSEIEPEPERERDAVAEAIGAILEQVMNRLGPPKQMTPESLALHMQSSFRNFIAMVYVLRPDLLPGNLPQWRYAEALGSTRQCLSRLCAIWSQRLGGMRGPGMRGEEAKNSYRASNWRPPKGITHRKSSAIGAYVDTTEEERSRRIIGEAVEIFRKGKPFHSIHRRELRLAGYLDDADQLTDKGRGLIEQKAGEGGE